MQMSAVRSQSITQKLDLFFLEQVSCRSACLEAAGALDRHVPKPCRPSMHDLNRELAARSAPHAKNLGTHYSIQEFAALLECLDLVITGDTIAMHIAIAVRKPLLVLFGSTCGPEIELYGRGRKIVSGLDCAPCYKRVCPIDEKCMREMSVEKIAQAAGEILNAA